MFPVIPDTDTETTAATTVPSLPSLLFPDFDSLLPGDDETGREPFVINDPSRASWAIARILEAQARMAERESLAGIYKARIEQWLATANQADESSATYLSFLLEPYVKDEVSKLHKSRTLSLPTGTASLRKLPDRLEITDNAVALAYCETEHPEAVVIRKELDKSALKDLILRQAEPVPGVEAGVGEDRLYIKPLRLKAA
jgi:hypothetical protein